MTGKNNSTFGHYIDVPFPGAGKPPKQAPRARDLQPHQLIDFRALDAAAVTHAPSHWRLASAVDVTCKVRHGDTRWVVEARYVTRKSHKATGSGACTRYVWISGSNMIKTVERALAHFKGEWRGWGTYE